MSSVVLYLIFRHSLLLNPELVILGDWLAREPLESALLLPSFYLDSRDLNSGSQACTAGRHFLTHWVISQLPVLLFAESRFPGI